MEVKFKKGQSVRITKRNGRGNRDAQTDNYTT